MAARIWREKLVASVDREAHLLRKTCRASGPGRARRVIHARGIIDSKADPPNVVVVPMEAALAALTGLGGYILGTLQVVFLDWRRERHAHRRHLRAVAGELRRVQTYLTHYDWPDQGPADDYVRAPPDLTSQFPEMILNVQWELTDEYLDDNTPDALLSVIDGVERLRHYSSQVRAWIDKAGDAQDPAAVAELRGELLRFTREYDRVVDVVEAVVGSALDDMARRRSELRLRSRVRRVLRPPGENPNPEAVLTPRPESAALGPGSA